MAVRRRVVAATCEEASSANHQPQDTDGESDATNDEQTEQQSLVLTDEDRALYREYGHLIRHYHRVRQAVINCFTGSNLRVLNLVVGSLFVTMFLANFIVRPSPYFNWIRGHQLRVFNMTNRDSTLAVSAEVGLWTVLAAVIISLIAVLLAKHHCLWIGRIFLTVSFSLQMFILWPLLVASVFYVAGIPDCQGCNSCIFLALLVPTVGVVALFWLPPTSRLHRFYKIFNTCLTAQMQCAVLPESVLIGLMAAMAAWDAFSVLSTSGPLNILMETYADETEPFAPMLAVCDSSESSDEDDTKTTTATESEPTITEEWADGISSEENDSDSAADDALVPSASPSTVSVRSRRLVLGDFVFYNTLLAKVVIEAQFLFSWFACVGGIIMGLCITFSLLTLWRNPLPGSLLPLTFGYLSYVIVEFLLGQLTTYFF